MRILFISNLYPPYSRGGYELWCQEVAVALAKRGHQVSVLTATAPTGSAIEQTSRVHVYRQLHLEVESGLAATIARQLWDKERREQENLVRLKELVEDFQPDVGLIWGMWNVPRSVPAMAEALLSDRLAYYFCDYWPSLPNAYVQRWQEPSIRGIARLPKRLMAQFFLRQLKQGNPVKLELRHPICVSHSVRDLLIEAGVPVKHASIIHGGIKPEAFLSVSQNGHRSMRQDIKLVYLGRLEVEKGVHTAIRALSMLSSSVRRRVSLDIVGWGRPDYEQELRELVKALGVEGTVKFRGGVRQEEVPKLLFQYDALLFPSEWEEPFARTVLEAMAAGLAVVGTTTGGTVEIISEGRNGLLFQAGNASDLATKTALLLRNKELRLALSEAGRKLVVEEFTLERMVDDIEAYLQQVLRSSYAL